METHEASSTSIIEVDGVTKDYIEVNIYIPDFLDQIARLTGMQIKGITPGTVGAFLDHFNRGNNLVITLEAAPRKR